MTQLRQHCYYPVLGVLILLAWGIIGCLLTWQTAPAIDRSHLSRFESKALTGWVADEPVVRGNNIRFPLDVTHVYVADGVRRVAGTMLRTVQVGDRSLADQMRYGDGLLI